MIWAGWPEIIYHESSIQVYLKQLTIIKGMIAILPIEGWLRLVSDGLSTIIVRWFSPVCMIWEPLSQFFIFFFTKSADLSIEWFPANRISFSISSRIRCIGQACPIKFNFHGHLFWPAFNYLDTCQLTTLCTLFDLAILLVIWLATVHTNKS